MISNHSLMRKRIATFFLFVSMVWALLPMQFALAVTVDVTATVVGCGDGDVGGVEQCDGADLNSATCISLGFTSGSLSCSGSCTFVTSSCSSGSSGGGGGGGGSSTSVISTTNAVFTGKAYPKSSVFLLKDAQLISQTTANENADFSFTLTSIASGDFVFTVYSEDYRGLRSSLYTFPLHITEGTTTQASGIMIAPTLFLDKAEVQQGFSIAMTGQSEPEAEVTAVVANGVKEVLVKGNADVRGVYTLQLETDALGIGKYYVRTQSRVLARLSPTSDAQEFFVGSKNIVVGEPGTAFVAGDLNQDRRVSIVDFSLMAYWYKKPSPPEAFDLNGDGKVDLVDLSIMARAWTG